MQLDLNEVVEVEYTDLTSLEIFDKNILLTLRGPVSAWYWKWQLYKLRRFIAPKGNRPTLIRVITLHFSAVTNKEEKGERGRGELVGIEITSNHCSLAVENDFELEFDFEHLHQQHTFSAFDDSEFESSKVKIFR